MADTPHTAEPVKPRRRWFQFRLRTLLIGATLLSLPRWWLGRQIKILPERIAIRNRFDLQWPHGA